MRTEIIVPIRSLPGERHLIAAIVEKAIDPEWDSIPLPEAESCIVLNLDTGTKEAYFRGKPLDANNVIPSEIQGIIRLQVETLPETIYDESGDRWAIGLKPDDSEIPDLFEIEIGLFS